MATLVPLLGFHLSFRHNRSCHRPHRITRGNMSFPVSQASGSQGRSKVPIPRIETRRPHQLSRRAGPPHRDRILIACTSCRERKVRCDGGQPQCQNCLDGTRSCIYLESRKNRLKVSVTPYKVIENWDLTASSATKHNHDMIDLLKELKDSVTDDTKQRIVDLLDRVR